MNGEEVWTLTTEGWGGGESWGGGEGWGGGETRLGRRRKRLGEEEKEAWGGGERGLGRRRKGEKHLPHLRH